MNRDVLIARDGVAKAVQAAYEQLCMQLPQTCIERGVPMHERTSFRIGGKADIWIEGQTEEQVLYAIEILHRTQCPYLVLGNGTNILVRDGGIRGAVLRIGKAMDRVEYQQNIVRAQAGILLSTLAKQTLSRGLAGMEFAVGIPGTLGGGVRMNAGAYGGEMKSCLKRVRCLWPDGRVEWRAIGGEDLGYRTSIFAREGALVLAAELQLREDTDGAAAQKARENNLARTTKQPLSLPSAGSAFKRPVGGYASRLIDQAGLKGVRVGGAQVSTLHAGFIVNTGGATAKDVLELVELVKARVQEHSGIYLELEFMVVGEDA